MANNILHFPSPLVKSDGTPALTQEWPLAAEPHVSHDELAKLRKAFDLARQTWPLEMAELPEMNKIQSGKK